MATQYKPSDVVTVRGVSKSLNEWASDLGTPVQTILGRLKRGQSIDKAVTKPINKTIGGHNRGRTMDADIVSIDDVIRLLDAAPDSETATRDEAFIVVAYRSGLRCSEICHLAWKDIDPAKGTIAVRHGKGDKHRLVAMDSWGWPYLQAWIELRSRWSVTKDSPLFCTRQGDPVDDRQVRAMIARRAKRAGIEKRVHAHGFRRSMASEMMAEGVNLMDISGALGHSNVSTTNTYLKRVNPASVVEAMKRRPLSQVVQPSLNLAGNVPPQSWLDRLRSIVEELNLLFQTI